jgi:hypothetical protein
MNYIKKIRKKSPKNNNKKRINKTFNMEITDTQWDTIARKLAKNGNSHTIAIPPQWIEELNLKDFVYIEKIEIEGVKTLIIRGRVNND